MDHESKKKAVKGVAWTSVGNWGCQLLSFCFYSTLARLLNPQTFGLVALAWVYIAFIQIFITQGFGTAIIQRRDLEEEHLDSAFWIAVTTASLFCLFSVVLAGPIAHFFKEPSLASVVPWLSLTMFFNALCSVQTAILTRDLNFRPLAVRSLVATGVSGAVGVTLAFLGFGVWSLVGQQLINAVLGCAFLWFAVPWRPRLTVSKRHLRDLYGFSLSITGNDLLWFFSKRSDQTVVGYTFGTAGLGPYSLASRIINLIIDGIVSPLQSVLLPALSRLQSEPAKFEQAVYRYCEISSFVLFPLFGGLAATAPVLVPLLFGAKWAQAIPIMQMLALYGGVTAALSFAYPMILAKGRAGFNFFMNVALSCMTLTGCVIATHWSPRAVALSLGVSTALFGAGYVVALQSTLKVRMGPMLKAFFLPAASSLLMLAAVVILRMQLTEALKPVITLFICVLAGAAIYIGTALLLRPDLIRTIREALRAMLLRTSSVDSLAELPASAEPLESAAAGSMNS
jgi:O-antigen/teichoic acid export membrane protein